MSYLLFDPGGSFGSSSSGPEDALNAVQFDAVPSATHGRTAEITDNPVETGADVSDNARKQPDTLTFTGVITNVPLVVLDLIRRGTTYAEDAWSQINEWMDNATPLSVVAGIDLYDNMLIESCNRLSDPGKGKAIHVDISLRTVRTVTTDTTDAPEPKTPRGKVRKDKGQKVTKDAEAGADAGILESVVGFAGGL